MDTSNWICKMNLNLFLSIFYLMMNQECDLPSFFKVVGMCQKTLRLKRIFFSKKLNWSAIIKKNHENSSLFCFFHIFIELSFSLHYYCPLHSLSLYFISSFLFCKQNPTRREESWDCSAYYKVDLIFKAHVATYHQLFFFLLQCAFCSHRFYFIFQFFS